MESIENGPKPTTFPLKKLPFVALRHVIQVMEIDEIVKTAITSKYMETIVKKCYIRIGSTEISFNGENTVIFIYNPDLIICCGNKTLLLDKGPNVMKKNFKSWFSETLTVLESTQKILPRVCDLFHCNQFSLIVVSEGVNSTTNEILKIPEFQNFKIMYLYGIEFTKRELDDVIDIQREDQGLHIVKGLVPIDYSHPNAFKYTDVHYWDARWIRLEHLLSIKNSTVITIGLNSLLPTDINKFLKFWANAEYDMFKHMHVDNTRREPIRFKTLFKGLDVLHGYRFGRWCKLIAVKSPDTRKRQILSVNWSNERIYMSTWDINERVQVIGQDDEPYAPEFEILKMLERRRALKMELKTVGEDEIRKQELNVAIDQITTGITLKGVTFRNGWPILSR
ncbi:hypothetical protein GCK72_003808 [Caenorhabditis remanei]|uniref:F-box domain-containing protein n=1 Tax=Caenorhabditis remanei TaxID=31234 RepID=A0A6A5HBT6_CAERE|nr:hypothetical protein GCK72_003808 [Caenorhabditis remanei]KAF1763862.1 hypothetical protein GCK72_003808 [Caenorhabditis remanei]